MRRSVARTDCTKYTGCTASIECNGCTESTGLTECTKCTECTDLLAESLTDLTVNVLDSFLLEKIIGTPHVIELSRFTAVQLCGAQQLICLTCVFWDEKESEESL